MTPLARRPLPDPLAPNAPEVEAAFQAVPGDMVAEILDGELHVMPRRARPHTNTASILGGELHAPFRRGKGGPGGWVILDEPELHLGPEPDIVVADLGGWRAGRLVDGEDVQTRQPIDQPPRGSIRLHRLGRS